MIGMAALSGCVVEADDRGRFSDSAIGGGEAVVDWTINGDKNPSECRQSDARSVVITVYSRGGRTLGDFEQDCEAFETAIPLPPGDYTAEATLLDYDGYERTTSVAISPFSLYGDDTVVLDIDFPASSFL
jgi:hypothetical protein